MNSRTEDVARHQNTTTERIDLPSFINQKASFTFSIGVNYLIRSSTVVLPSMHQSTILGKS